ncbi:MAG: hypothetical protein WKG07_22805 [Hymenobacter sp.]
MRWMAKRASMPACRSGCYFCFFQREIEWVRLCEQHPDKFECFQPHEKDGYTWMEESLTDLIGPERIRQIKLDTIAKQQKTKFADSPFLLDVLGDEEEVGCASCFI